MDFISEIIGSFVWMVVGVPILWILATPFILVLSFFGKGTYVDNAKQYYARIKKGFWRD